MSLTGWMSTLAVVVAAAACGGGGGDNGGDAAAPAQPGGGASAPVIQTLSSGLDRPWGIAQLPDGRLLVTQKGGSIVRLSAAGAKEATLSGVPQVLDSGRAACWGSPWIRTSPAPAATGSTSPTPSRAPAPRPARPAPRWRAAGSRAMR